MLINIDVVIMDLKGVAIKEAGPESDDLTLRQAMVTALLQEGKANDMNEKSKRFLLAMKVSDHPKDTPIELKSEDISKAKELIGNLFVTIVAGRCEQMLEKAVEPLKEVAKPALPDAVSA